MNRELQKEEALKRMEMLGIFEASIKAFRDRDEVQLTEPPGFLYEFNDNEKLKDTIEEFEKKHEALVYHVIHSYTGIGEMYSLLYVSKYNKGWRMDHEDIENGFVFSYVINCDAPECSEFGSILVENHFGGLVRIG